MIENIQETHVKSCKMHHVIDISVECVIYHPVVILWSNLGQLIVYRVITLESLKASIQGPVVLGDVCCSILKSNYSDLSDIYTSIMAKLSRRSTKNANKQCSKSNLTGYFKR